MKKIALWKVILLSVVTFGIYAIVWFARRRNELVETYKQHIPHWLWIVLPPIVAVVIMIPTVLALSLFIPDKAFAYVVSMICVAILSIIPFGISIWWMSRYSAAASRVIEGRVPTVWGVLVYLFWGPCLAYVHQYYFNRYASGKVTPKENWAGPSRKFIILAVISFIVSVGLSTLSLSTYPAEYEKMQQDIKNTSDTVNEANELRTQYFACANKLEADFPGELTLEDEDAYNAAFDVCEDIRVRQNEAANRVSQP